MQSKDTRTTILMRNSISQSGQNKKNLSGTRKVRVHTEHMPVKFLELDRVDVVHKLVENIVDIEFIKEKDIELRKMRCTLMDTEIPDDKMPKSEMLWNYQDTDKVIKVFDLDLQQWRAFRLENVTRFDISC